MGLTLRDARLSRTPPVCVCAVPKLTGGCRSCDRSHAVGECRRCHRPYKPEVPGFDAVRQAWLDQLTEEALSA